MPNRTILKERVEPHVRSRLAQKFGKPFRSEFLPLSGVEDRPAKHEFDAVSEDRKFALVRNHQGLSVLTCLGARKTISPRLVQENTRH